MVLRPSRPTPAQVIGDCGVVVVVVVAAVVLVVVVVVVVVWRLGCWC